MVYESGIIPILKVAPEYPSRALARGMEGDVGMKFSIGNDGRPHSIIIIDGLDNPLDKAAIEALGHAVFDLSYIGDSGVAIAKFRLSQPLWQ